MLIQAVQWSEQHECVMDRSDDFQAFLDRCDTGNPQHVRAASLNRIIQDGLWPVV
jgi:hypothetical protein